MIKNIPKDIGAENAIIGACMIRSKAYLEVAEMTSEMFFSSDNKEIYTAIQDCYKKHGAIDLVLIKGLVKDGIYQKIISCVEECPTTINIEYYKKNVIEQYRKRKAQNFILDTLAKIDKEEQNADEIVSSLHDFATGNVPEEEENISKSIERYFKHSKEIQSLRESGKEYKNSWGIKEIDDLLGCGLPDGKYGVIGAYTSVGKTFFLLNIIAEQIRQNKKCLFYSLEMADEDILNRLVSIMTGIPMNKTKVLGTLNPEDKKTVWACIEQIKASGFKIASKLTSIEMILLDCERERVRNGIDMVFIDYLQLITSQKKTDYETQKYISQSIQNYTKQKNKTFICLSQVSNEHAKFGGDTVIGFKGSGDIAASADFAIELSTKETQEDRKRAFKENKPVELKFLCKKNRIGGAGELYLNFNLSNGIMAYKSLESSIDDKTINKNQDINKF